MKQLYRILTVFIIGIIASCTNYVAEEVPNELSVNPSALISIEADNTVMTVRSGEVWDIPTIPDWVSISSIKQSKNSSYEWEVVLSSSKNTGYNRSGEMIVKTRSQSKTLTIFQKGDKGDYIALTGIEIDDTVLTLVVGEQATLSAIPVPSNASEYSVNWTSSNTSVATVSSDGVITAKSVGTSTITVKTSDGKFSDTCTVTVRAAEVPVTGVTLDKTTLSMTVGDTQSLTATVSPSNASDKTVSWISSNSSVATVSSSGVVTAKSAGSATITVSTKDGGKTATCTVTVKSPSVPVTGVSLNYTTLSLNVGETKSLVATIYPSNATNKSITYSSSNSSVASVDYYGKVTAVKAGTAVITATSSDNPSKKATCSVTVAYVPHSNAKIAPKSTYVTVDNAQTKDYSVEVRGDVDTSASAANRYHYFIRDMPFKDYLKVVDYSLDSETLLVDLKTSTQMSAGNSVIAPTSPVGLNRLNEDRTVANLAADMTYSWGTYDSLQFSVSARLIPANAPEGTIVDQATVRFWTKNPIPVFDAGEMVVVEHDPQKEFASVNIAAALRIADLNGIRLNDSNGLRPIGYDTKTREYVVNYDQALVYDKIVLISGADYIEELPFSWDATKPGVLNLRLNQGIILEPIIINVRVILTHMLGRGLENTAWVTVKFVEKGMYY